MHDWVVLRPNLNDSVPIQHSSVPWKVARAIWGDSDSISTLSRSVSVVLQSVSVKFLQFCGIQDSRFELARANAAYGVHRTHGPANFIKSVLIKSVFKSVDFIHKKCIFAHSDIF